MPLTLGLNVSNDHLLMISISYHHFYVLFISYTMISYNSDSRERTPDLWPSSPALPRSKLRLGWWEKAWTNLNFILIPASHYHIKH